jgi:hypothetical protein
MNEVDRVKLICEDRRQEQFFRQILGKRNLRILDVDRPPAGHGSASAYVLGKLPDAVRELRSKNHQRGFGILFAVDGDNLGLTGRLAQIQESLQSVGLAAPARLALAIPTWSIETWLLWLTDGRILDEAESHKQTFEREFRDSRDQAAAIRHASTQWARIEADGLLPSLDHGRGEIDRLTQS